MKQKYKYKIEFRGKDDSKLSVNNGDEHLQAEFIISAKDEAEARDFITIIFGPLSIEGRTFEILEFSKVKKYTFKKK